MGDKRDGMKLARKCMSTNNNAYSTEQRNLKTDNQNGNPEQPQCKTLFALSKFKIIIINA